MAETFPFTLGKYEIESELGHGGFSTVYLARDKDLDRRVALKIMAPALMRDTAWIRRFRQEARVMAKLDHPNIVPINEIDEEDGRLYLAMKLIEGFSLATLIENRGKLDIDTTRSILKQVAEALDYAYSQGVVHHDLKPANILLTGNTAMLTDFGLARLVQNNTQSFSVSGGVLGTPSYMAPEVWDAKAEGQSSDIYALGCILFEAVTGKVLFKGETVSATMRAHFKPAQLPAVLPDDVPGNVLGIIRRAVAQDPRQRYETATDMAEDLERSNVDPLALTYASLRLAMNERRWLDALPLAEQIQAQDPGYRDVEDLKDESQRNVWASEWRQQAENSLASGDYDLAIRAAKKWLEIAPEDPAANEMPDKIGRAQEVKRLKTSISQAIKRQEWQRAGKLLELLQKLAPQDPELASIRDQINVARQSGANKQGQQLAGLKREASTAIDRQNWPAAEDAIERLKALAPGDPEIATLLGQLNAGRKQQEMTKETAFWRNQTEEAIATQHWDSAQKLVQRWLQLDPDDSAAKQARITISGALARQQPSQSEPDTRPAEPPKKKSRTRNIVIGVSLLALLMCSCLAGLAITRGWIDATASMPTQTPRPRATSTPRPVVDVQEPAPTFDGINGRASLIWEAESVLYVAIIDTYFGTGTVDVSYNSPQTGELQFIQQDLVLETVQGEWFYVGSNPRLLDGSVATNYSPDAFHLSKVDSDNWTIDMTCDLQGLCADVELDPMSR